MHILRISIVSNIFEKVLLVIFFLSSLIYKMIYNRLQKWKRKTFKKFSGKAGRLGLSENTSCPALEVLTHVILWDNFSFVRKVFLLMEFGSSNASLF